MPTAAYFAAGGGGGALNTGSGGSFPGASAAGACGELAGIPGVA